MFLVSDKDVWNHQSDSGGVERRQRKQIVRLIFNWLIDLWAADLWAQADMFVSMDPYKILCVVNK